MKFHDSDEQSGRLLQRSQLYIQNAIISPRISAAMLLCWGISSFLHLLAAPGNVAAAFCTMPVLLKLGKQNQSSQFAGFVASDRMHYGDSTPEHGRIHYFEDDVLSRNEWAVPWMNFAAPWRANLPASPDCYQKTGLSRDNLSAMHSATLQGPKG